MPFESHLLLLLLVLPACGVQGVRRFPQGQAVLEQDDDRRPFVTPCRSDPKRPGHRLCAPKPYVSPYLWDAADNSVFYPLSQALAVETEHEAINVNALDEVPDSSWFTNRIGRHELSPLDISEGPCRGAKTLAGAHDLSEWPIDQGKFDGSSPGFRVNIPGTGKFLLKADPAVEPERATAAAVIAGRLYYAAGWSTPCENVVYFDPGILGLGKGLVVKDNGGVERPLDHPALDRMLETAAHRGNAVRMLASRWLPGRTIGPFTYRGRRTDDLNDVIAHEDRRDLRGARLIAAWLGHWDAREQNTMNTWLALDESDPDSTPGYVQHWYLDFGDSLGQQRAGELASRRLGHAYLLDLGYIAEDFFSLGAIERAWDRARTEPGQELFGFFGAHEFRPELWRTGYPNPAFARMTERDGAWAARIIAEFRPEHVRAAVDAGNFSDRRHADYLYDVLLERQRAILRRYLGVLSPLARVRIEGDELCATDLARRSGVFGGDAAFHYRARAWAGAALGSRDITAPRVMGNGAVCVRLPRLRAGNAPAGAVERYLIVDLENGSAQGPLRVHLYDLGSRGFELAGLERLRFN